MSRYYCSSFGASSVARSVIFSPYNVSTQLLCVVRCEIEIMGPDLKDFIIFLQTGGLQVGWDSVMRMSADKRDLFLYEAFLYFNPLLLAVSSSLLTVCTFSCHCVDAWVHPFASTFVIIVFYLFFIFQALMVWLWGINLWFFSQGGVNYAKIFDLDQNHLTHREIWKVSTHHFDLSLVWHIKSAFARSKGNKNGSVMTWEQE